MSTVPLNLIRPLLYSHMAVVNNPADMTALFNAFTVSCDAFDEYYEGLMAFDRDPVPLNDRKHDVRFYCMLIMASSKLNIPREKMMLIGMDMVAELWKDTGLSIEAFVDLLDDDDVLRDSLRQYLQLCVLEAADESKVQ